MSITDTKNTSGHGTKKRVSDRYIKIPLAGSPSRMMRRHTSMPSAIRTARQWGWVSAPVWGSSFGRWGRQRRAYSSLVEQRREGTSSPLNICHRPIAGGPLRASSPIRACPCLGTSPQSGPEGGWRHPRWPELNLDRRKRMTTKTAGMHTMDFLGRYGHPRQMPAEKGRVSREVENGEDEEIRNHTALRWGWLDLFFFRDWLILDLPVWDVSIPPILNQIPTKLGLSNTIIPWTKCLPWSIENITII